MNKHLRFFIFEPSYRFSLIGLIVLSLASLFLFKMFVAETKELNKVKAEKDLVAQTASMQKTIQANTVQTVSGEEKVQKVELVLEGIGIQDGVPTALIDGTVYNVGDSAGEYVVIEITKNSTTLENKTTQERKILQFFEDPSVEAVIPVPTVEKTP